jgi:hypothetical protein
MKHFFGLGRQRLRHSFWSGSPGPTAPFALLRIGVALIALVQSLAALPYLDDFIGPSAIIQPEVARLFIDPVLPRVDPILSLLNSHGLSLEAASRTMWGGWIFLLIMLLTGCWTRTTAWLVWFAHLAIKSSSVAVSYGASEFLNILFFYTALGPSGELWSVDSLIRRRRRQWDWRAGLILRIMRLHLCAVYASSGIEKALAPAWWNGEALWRALGREDIGMSAPWLASVPWILYAAGWWTVAVEVGYTPMVMWRKTRWLWLAQIAFLHIGIGLFLGLWLFSAAMLLFNAAAFAPLWRDRRRSPIPVVNFIYQSVLSWFKPGLST